MPYPEQLQIEEAFAAAVVVAAVVLLQLILPASGRRVFAWVAAGMTIVLVGVDFAPESMLLAVAVALLAGLIKPLAVSVPLTAGALALAASRFPDGFSDPLVTATVLLALVAGAAVFFVERLSGRRWLSVLLAISAAGVFASVPDTEQVTVVLVGLGVLGGGYLLLGGRLDGTEPLLAGGATLVVLLVWAGGVGAIGRPAALAGVAACLGVLLALPVAWLLLTPLRRSHDPTVPLYLLVGLQVVLIYPASRIVGLDADNESAFAGAALLLIGVTVALGLSGLVAALIRGPRSAVAGV